MSVFIMSLILSKFQKVSMHGSPRPPCFIGSLSWAISTGGVGLWKMNFMIFWLVFFIHDGGGDGSTIALWVSFERMNVFRAVILPMGEKIWRPQKLMPWSSRIVRS